MIQRFPGFRVAPMSECEVSNNSTVLGADCGKEGVHGRGVLDSEGVAGVEDWTGFGIDSLIEK